jgi:hypothetical protein
MHFFRRLHIELAECTVNDAGVATMSEVSKAAILVLICVLFLF